MTTPGETRNVATRLTATAQRMPDATAIAMPAEYGADGQRQYRTLTFRELDETTNRIASSLRRMGVTPGTRLVLMVKPGIEFIALTFGLMKAGAVVVLIDPGMGIFPMLGCLEEVRPEGFVAISLVQALRNLLFWKFRDSKFNVTVGWRWFWWGETYEGLLAAGDPHFQADFTRPDDSAAIIFTTGSTGPAKGVLYSHGNFWSQVDEIRDFYGIQPGEIDLPGFPLFALFNCAMGVTTVIPDMDFTRPAQADPKKILEGATDWKVTQAFGSPALWNAVGQYCETHQIRIPTLRRVLSAGAPVPPHVLARMKQAIHPAGDIHTPYGATESLPVASISASEVLGETAAKTARGAGTCVGRHFPCIDWRVIEISDGPLATIADCRELPQGEIGEIIVRGPVVTREYVTQTEANPLHKIQDGPSFWHRIGDVGYLDEQGRFWFCGRRAHRVRTSAGEMYTEPCEAVFNTHPSVYRSALVGIGSAGNQRPVIAVECWPAKKPQSAGEESKLLEELRVLAQSFPHTARINDILLHPALPVDIRHNAKIFREQLAPWAASQLGVV